VVVVVVVDDVDVDVVVDEEVAGLVVVVVVDDVDVDVVVDEEVAGLVVVVLVVVVGTIVEVVDVMPAVVDSRVLGAAGGSVVREDELVDASHPMATATRVRAGSVTSRLN
jgi:hypothetical protein